MKHFKFPDRRMAKQFENEHFPLAQKEEEEKAEDLTMVKAVGVEDFSAVLGRLATAKVMTEMRENAAVKRFIWESDPFFPIVAGNPASARAWLDQVALNPAEYCRQMSERHQYVMRKMAEHCLRRKL